MIGSNNHDQIITIDRIKHSPFHLPSPHPPPRLPSPSARSDASGEPESSSKFYCLPDNYPIHDTSLSDLKRAYECSFTPPTISQLNANTDMSRDVFGNSYLPGYVGSVDLGKTDYVSAAVTAIGQVEIIRDYFLLSSEKSLPGFSNGGGMGTVEKVRGWDEGAKDGARLYTAAYHTVL